MTETSTLDDNTEGTHTNLKNPSTFFPKYLKSSFIETFESLVIRDIKKIPSRDKYKNNLTREERIALKNLKKDQTIVIKPADKGGGVVVMDTDKYLAEITHQLKQIETYIILPNNPVSQFKIELKKILEGLEMKVLNKKEFEYLDVAHPRTPIIYIC